MKQWAGLGKFLAGHMQIIVPICVALGVLFPQQIGVLKPIVPALFAFIRELVCMDMLDARMRPYG